MDKYFFSLFQPTKVIEEDTTSMVVAQLVERSLPTPEVPSSNPIIGEFYILSTVLNMQIKKDRSEMEHFTK